MLITDLSLGSSAYHTSRPGKSTLKTKYRGVIKYQAFICCLVALRDNKVLLTSPCLLGETNTYLGFFPDSKFAVTNLPDNRQIKLTGEVTPCSATHKLTSGVNLHHYTPRSWLAAHVQPLTCWQCKAPDMIPLPSRQWYSLSPRLYVTLLPSVMDRINTIPSWSNTCQSWQASVIDRYMITKVWCLFSISCNPLRHSLKSKHTSRSWTFQH